MANVNNRKALLLGALVLVCALAAARLSGSIRSFYEFQRAHLALRSSPSQAKNTPNATDLPDVDFSRLTEKQKQEARLRLNAESCTCGCKLTLTDCRVNDSTCPISKVLAAEVVDQVRAGKPKSSGPEPQPLRPNSR
jgi:hypothetical protein